MAGGGGGGILGRYDPQELSRKTREAEDAVRDDRFEAAVNDYLASLLAQFNDRDVTGITEILDRAKSELQDEIEGTVDLLFGGSVAKHTYVDGLSDIDALVCLQRQDIAGKSPDQVKGLFADRLRSRFGSDAVYEGALAVTLNLEGKWIQLLPAIKEGQKFKIASSDGKSWTSIRPRDFAKALTDTNTAMGGKLVPTIKLAKAIIATLPEQRRLSGYHVESLAIKVFKNYDHAKTPKTMLRHFFEHAPASVREPIRDSTGQSVHVDDYLGPADSLKRRIIADSLGQIGRKLKNADGARSLDLWKEPLEETS
jgi:hypothetical protein